MRYKEKSIFNFLNQDHHQIITQKFLQVLKKKKINEDLVYKFLYLKQSIFNYNEKINTLLIGLG